MNINFKECTQVFGAKSSKTEFSKYYIFQFCHNNIFWVKLNKMIQQHIINILWYNKFIQTQNSNFGANNKNSTF